MRRWLGLAIVAGAWSILLDAPALLLAQASGEPVIRDTNVGYIDTAIPGNYLRLRYDDVFNNQRPTRDVFFWAPGGSFGPGPRIPESSVNYQDIGSYAEGLIANLNDADANYLKLTAQKDGSFTVQNSRNKFEKSYPPPGTRK